MSADLFGSLDEAKRQRLRARGWIYLPDTCYGACWRRPSDKAVLVEAEAFAQLERLEAETAPRPLEA